ncbi:MAG: Abi family protein [Verrucomicrobia bacterium]|nr:Abi family protein [Verrucomicrobiota bacterium]
MKFDKPALSFAEQLAKLQGRGLLVADYGNALRHLKHIGYYRLSAYALPFQDCTHEDKPFRADTRFEMLLDLYRFDRELRLLVLDAIERIEVALRSAINNEMAMCHGPHWFMDPRQFSRRFDHAALLADVEREMRIAAPGGRPTQPHQEVFINHYYTKYGDPYLPPSWMVMETFSLGSLSRLYAGLASGAERIAVANYFGTDEFVLQGWFHVLSYVRNLCAHHARLWNRRLVIKFRQVARRHRSFLNSNDQFFAVAVVLYDLLHHVVPDTQWNVRLRDLINRYPVAPLGAMGFPADWRQVPFWRLPHPP